VIRSGPDRIAIEVGARHAERLEDVHIGEGAERLTARPFQDSAEQQVTAVVVAVFGAGGGIQTALARQDRNERVIRITVVRRPALQNIGVTESARMGKQVPDGDAMLAVGPIRDVLRHVVVQRQQTALGCEQDTHRRKRLRDRRQMEHGGGCDGNLPFKTRHSITALVDDGALSADSDATAR
jgi:hypothetical protein